jgi:hypothetical protein
MRRLMIGMCVLTAVFVIGCTREKDRLDAEVKRLCAIDGGVKIYEVVTLPPERFRPDSGISIPNKTEMKEEDEFFYLREEKYLKQGSPEFRRNKTQIWRKADNKLLGEVVSYHRRGGDMYGPWHDSFFSCPERYEFESKIFIKQSK